jgi:hypothetical protein
VARQARLGRRAAGLAVVAALLLAAGCGPVPGGRLRGEVEPPPADWAPFTEGLSGICEIESRPEDPHSIQLQCYEFDGALYVHSHRWALASWYPFTSWAAIWLDHPEVRVRFGDSLYELHAERVVDAPLREEILHSRGYDPVPDGILLFHLRPRTSAG